MSFNKPITVELSTDYPKLPYFRQTPEGLGQWGIVQFLVDDGATRADFSKTWCWMETETKYTGVPLVAEKKDGISKQIIHGETGFLCDIPDEFAQYVSQLFDNPGLYKPISKNATLVEKQQTITKEPDYRNNYICLYAAYLKHDYSKWPSIFHKIIKTSGQ